jgi:hypothetical protein
MSYPTIYFYNSEEEGNYQRDIIPLAEGFEALGIPFYSHADYWNRDPYQANYLFRASPEVDPRDCDVIIVPGQWVEWKQAEGGTRSRDLPDWLFQSGRRWKTVTMDFTGGFQSPAWRTDHRQFDLILKANYNARCTYPENFRPWAIGFHNRAMAYLDETLPYEHRIRELLVSFIEPHPVREDFLRLFAPELEEFGVILNHTRDDLTIEPEDPYEALWWRQTGRKHAFRYYERLAGAPMCACFSGEMIPGKPEDPAPFADPSKKPLRRLLWKLWSDFSKQPDRIIQWDSERFWDSLVAGAVPVHVDLETYGVSLPAMPENYVHYVGISYEDPDPAIELLSSDRELLHNISQAGQGWALNNYSPQAVAERFLRITEAVAS